MPLITLFLIYFLLCCETNATELDDQVYRITSNKQYMSSCMKKSIELHNGYIKKQSIIDINKHFFVEYEIQTQKGIWLVTCDLDTGEITKEENIYNKKTTSLIK